MVELKVAERESTVVEACARSHGLADPGNTNSDTHISFFYYVYLPVRRGGIPIGDRASPPGPWRPHKSRVIVRLRDMDTRDPDPLTLFYGRHLAADVCTPYHILLDKSVLYISWGGRGDGVGRRALSGRGAPVV